MEARFLPHRGVVGGAPGRLPELLEQLKLEIDQLSHDANVYKLQRDDFERKRTWFRPLPPAGLSLLVKSNSSWRRFLPSRTRYLNWNARRTS